MNKRSRQDKLDRLAGLMESMPMHIPADSQSEFPEHELTLTQVKAMTLLQQGPQRMGDIARNLDISLSSVTNLVGRLESKDLVRRIHDTDDRRVVTCELTPESLRAVTWIWQLGRNRMLSIADYLDDSNEDAPVPVTIGDVATVENRGYAGGERLSHKRAAERRDCGNQDPGRQHRQRCERRDRHA